MLYKNFNNKTVLITGHTGFKGSWLAIWLKELGANVVGISLDPPTFPSHYDAAQIRTNISDLRIDIRSNIELSNAIVNARPDFVFHLAAQALVQNSYENPIDTWQTNVIGTLNVLEALRKLDNRCSAVLVTSDKCYLNREWIWGYREVDRLGGIDPYSASKASAEMAIYSHINSYFPSNGSKVRIASARAGNVIGGGDWAAKRIIPDCVNAWSCGDSVELRSPHSTRPWQHVLEPLSGYLNLAIKLLEVPDLHGESFNFGPESNQNHTVLDLVTEMSNHWDRVRWSNASTDIAKYKESTLLKLDCDKASHHLNWKASMNFEQTVKLTADWYGYYYQNSKNIAEKTKLQIKEYAEIAREKGISWAI